jgi:hypothetical protein
MLEKKPGVIIVDKLRAIILLEADFNFANKLILGVRMMHNAEELGLVVPEALGSRNGHDSLELALDHRLAIDLSRLKIEPIAVASVDVAQCKDWVLVAGHSGTATGPMSGKLLRAYGKGRQSAPAMDLICGSEARHMEWLRGCWHQQHMRQYFALVNVTPVDQPQRLPQSDLSFRVSTPSY